MTLTTTPTSTPPGSSADDAGAEALAPIRQRYLLVIGIRCYGDRDGKRWVDAMWHKDLAQHVRYLANLTLAAPLHAGDVKPGMVCLDDDPTLRGVRFIDLPNPRSVPALILRVPKSIGRLWTAIGQADVVQGGVAGWPMPLGWIVIPIAKLRGKFLVVNVESAFWRVFGDGTNRPPLRKRARAKLSEIINRWCVRRANFATFTQEGYRRELLGDDPTRGHVVHASWVDEAHVLDDATAEHGAREKRHASPDAASLLFAGRLAEEKGVGVLLQAAQELAKQNVPLRIDFVGDGELLPRVKQAAEQSSASSVRIRLLGPVPYGPEFFGLLRRYEALVVPSISDEQPRVVYDAYSQAVPVLATNTTGLRDCVVEGETGRLVERNDPAALASLLQWSAENRDALRGMGLEALRLARGRTHRAMHDTRWRLLSNALAKRTG
jgi:glycosyltransferase involved in cell wall biosynthesis